MSTPTPNLPAPVIGKFNVQLADQSGAEVAKTPVHWPYVGFSFANNQAKAEDNLYPHVNSFIDFCGENLEEQFLEMYLEDNAPGVNSIFEQFMRWYFTQSKSMAFRWKKTDSENAWVIYHTGLTANLQAALDFSVNGDYVINVKSMEYSLKLVDAFQQEVFKTMPLPVYETLFNGDYFGITMSRHF